MSMIKSISREEESKIPAFSSYVEARQWFQEKYGDAFVLAGADETYDGQTYFICHLVLKPVVYENGMKKLANGESVTGIDFLFSHQKIEIFEDGQVHIIH